MKNPVRRELLFYKTSSILSCTNLERPTPRKPLSWRLKKKRKKHENSSQWNGKHDSHKMKSFSKVDLHLQGKFHAFQKWTFMKDQTSGLLNISSFQMQLVICFFGPQYLWNEVSIEGTNETSMHVTCACYQTCSSNSCKFLPFTCFCFHTYLQFSFLFLFFL